MDSEYQYGTSHNVVMPEAQPIFHPCRICAVAAQSFRHSMHAWTGEGS